MSGWFAAVAASALAFWGTAALAQTAATGTEERPAPAAAGTGPAAGLEDLDAMTFDCAKTGLNAAAREAAKTEARGTYQFAYFKIIADSHHAAYEVHFRSNHHADPELKYCVAVYCQQGWDRATTAASVRRIGDGRRHAAAMGHAAACDHRPPAAARRRPER